MKIQDYATSLLEDANSIRASDIHILPENDRFTVSFRTTNGLVPQALLNLEEGKRLVSYFKYLGNMDVGENRRPQSGAASIVLEGEEKTIRLSTMTTYTSHESLVIRMLNPSKTIPLHKNTYFPNEIYKMERLVKYKSGLILFSGPVSSGKTTTMYNIVSRRIQKSKEQVITIEDPVEIEEKDFLQIQVNEAADITYDVLLRQSLRHHPDILIIGEIRDEQTAHACIRAALTGHLVLASLHSKNAEGVFARFIELGATKELLDQTLIGIIFQKMIPRFCPLCEGNCHLSCSHFSAQQKQAVLFDIRTGNAIKNMSSENNDYQKKYDFNQWLRKAYVYGYISKENYESFQIPE